MTKLSNDNVMEGEKLARRLRGAPAPRVLTPAARNSPRVRTLRIERYVQQKHTKNL